eukprot:TRINITY_DN774_c0_g1_i2.p1 TRINITY_DN774_c0_g1~~TRINITY_DN774_c0_g1_i2.p1  ORF type:complete len:341 (-),score=113.31 TRINITY_DN774_c0_g1_i2:62-1084(-)
MDDYNTYYNIPFDGLNDDFAFDFQPELQEFVTNFQPTDQANTTTDSTSNLQIESDFALNLYDFNTPDINSIQQPTNMGGFSHFVDEFDGWKQPPEVVGLASSPFSTASDSTQAASPSDFMAMEYSSPLSTAAVVDTPFSTASEAVSPGNFMAMEYSSPLSTMDEPEQDMMLIPEMTTTTTMTTTAALPHTHSLAPIDESMAIESQHTSCTGSTKKKSKKSKDLTTLTSIDERGVMHRPLDTSDTCQECVCGKTYKKRSRLFRHIRDVEKLQCPHCSVSRNRRYIENHIRSVHAPDIPCEYCPGKLFSHISIKQHEQSQAHMKNVQRANRLSQLDHQEETK